MPRILVTGANGFIAAHCIARLLQSNLLVRGTVRSAAKAEATRAALISAGIDVTNLELVAVPDLMDAGEMASVMVDCDSAAEQQRLFDALAQGGRVYMPLDDYGFGPFGWVGDRFGLTWQLAAPTASR